MKELCYELFNFFQLISVLKKKGVFYIEKLKIFPSDVKFKL